MKDYKFIEKVLKDYKDEKIGLKEAMFCIDGKIEENQKEMWKKINKIEEWGETYCEYDERLLKAIKKEVKDIIKKLNL